MGMQASKSRYSGIIQKYVKVINVRVNGRSMTPYFEDGQRITVEKFSKQGLKKGDIIVYRHPIDKNRNVIHRIERIEGDKKYRTKGDAWYEWDNYTVGEEDIIGVYREGKDSAADEKGESL